MMNYVLGLRYCLCNVHCPMYLHGLEIPSVQNGQIFGLVPFFELPGPGIFRNLAFPSGFFAI